jgi:hypothetical protein
VFIHFRLHSSLEHHTHNYHLAIKFLHALLKVDRFFFVVGGGRDTVEAESNVSSDLTIPVGVDTVVGSASGTGTSDNPTAPFSIPKGFVIVIGVVTGIIIDFIKFKAKTESSSTSQTGWTGCNLIRTNFFRKDPFLASFGNAGVVNGTVVVD